MKQGKQSGAAEEWGWGVQLQIEWAGQALLRGQLRKARKEGKS